VFDAFTGQPVWPIEEVRFRKTTSPARRRRRRSRSDQAAGISRIGVVESDLIDFTTDPRPPGSKRRSGDRSVLWSCRRRQQGGRYNRGATSERERRA